MRTATTIIQMAIRLIGVIMIVSVAISGLVAGFSRELLDLLGLDQGLAPELAVLVVLLGGAADLLLFFAIFTLLVRPRLPNRSLWAGALLGAIGAELLKWLSSFLIGLTKDQPAFQAFGIALILLVWINYFSRVVVYAAAWAFTTVQRGVPEVEPVSAVAAVDPLPPAVRERRTTPEVPPSAWVGSGAALTLALVALLRRRKKD